MGTPVTLRELTWEADDRSFFFTRLAEEDERFSEAELELQAIALSLAEPQGQA